MLASLLRYEPSNWMGLSPKLAVASVLRQLKAAGPCYTSCPQPAPAGPSFVTTCILGHLAVQLTPKRACATRELAEQTAALFALLYMKGVVDSSSRHCHVVPVGFPPTSNPESHVPVRCLADSLDLPPEEVNLSNAEPMATARAPLSTKAKRKAAGQPTPAAAKRARQVPGHRGASGRPDHAGRGYTPQVRALIGKHATACPAPAVVSKLLDIIFYHHILLVCSEVCTPCGAVCIMLLLWHMSYPSVLSPSFIVCY